MSSKKKNNYNSQDYVMQELQNLFGQTLHTSIIKSVASSCNFDIMKSSNVLLEMTSNVDDGCVKKAKINRPSNTSTSSLVKRQELGGQQQRLQPSASSGAIAKKSKKAMEIDRVVKLIQKGYRVLVLLRGMPGSGKSHLGKMIAHASLGPGTIDRHILSTDDYFMTANGYCFDPVKLSEAHGWNHSRAHRAMVEGLSPVIIDNTNLQMWEMKPYAMMATDYGYYIEVLEPDTWWALNEKELAKRNVHGVTKGKIKDMLERYDKNVTSVKLLSMYSLQYQFLKPPQMRKLPPYNPTQNGYITSNSYEVKKSRSVSAFETVAFETLNLMDFEEPKLTYNTEASPGFWQAKDLNPVDEILMCSEQNGSSVLQPEVSKADVATKLYNDGRNAWGLDEEALQSWDLVTPVNDQREPIEKWDDFSVHIPEVAKDIREIGTNVDADIFDALLKNEVPDGCAVIEGTSRYISSMRSSLSIPSKSSGKKLMHDKSCWTEADIDIVGMNEEESKHIIQLTNLFPKVRRSYLIHLYNSCNKNFYWTMEILLSDNSQHNLDDSNKVEDGGSDDDIDEISYIENGTASSSNPVVEQSRRCSKLVSDEAVALKKTMESKFEIGRQHYSKHVLKVKQYKFGSYEPDPEEASAMSSDFEMTTDELEEEPCDYSETNPKDIVELNLGASLPAQLGIKFGMADDILQGFQPVVQMPTELARQIYMLYMESVYQQMEAQDEIMAQLVKEDEEFARKIQSHEDSVLTQPEPQKELSLNEIMDEQVAANLYRRDTERWKSMSVDNIAAKLTRQKLFTAFPFVDQDAILEILHANDNDYKKTVDDLYSSVGSESANGSKETIEEPPLSDNALDEMKEAERISLAERKQSQEEHPATYYRDEANRHLRRREDLYQKAQSYYQRGMTDVALFYSDLAKKETSSYDTANNLAANEFLREHSLRLQDNKTLDLHYLYVKEAISALDIFIDQNIDTLNNRRGSLSQELYIITGRGKNSQGGISKIKPAVITRLKRRNIMFAEMNPGLLKIKVTHNSRITSDMPS